MMTSGIYVILNIYNDKVYVGSGINLKQRWIQHRSDLSNNRHKNMYLQSVFNKYWINPFIFTVLEYCNREKLIEREQYWINELKSCGNGYNLRPIANSLLGFKHSKESNLKKSIRTKGNKYSLGYKHSEEARKKISSSNMGKLATVRKLDKWPHEKGVLCRCDECKRKIADYALAYYHNKRKSKLFKYEITSVIEL